jgi:peptidoglycan/xylan/chitin deacetylase (PgdA/CDA1 family)
LFLPILFHDILTGDPETDRAGSDHSPCVLPGERFERLVRLLQVHGYSSVLTADLLRSARRGEPLPGKAAAITFDDGHSSNFTEALPILKRYGMRAIFFVTTGWIGRPGMLTWEQLGILQSEGMEIGSHTVNHPIPPELGEEELRRELVDSKRALDAALSSPVLALSSPTGFHDPRMRRLSKDAGYEAMYVGITRLADPIPRRMDLHWINRIDVKAGMPVDTFEGLLEGRALSHFSVRGKEYLLGVAKSLLGPTNYNRVRTFVLGRAA